MTIEFVKAHTTKDGRSYVAGQLTDVDAAAAEELIKLGIAKERKPAGAAGAAAKPDDEGSEASSKPKG